LFSIVDRPPRDHGRFVIPPGNRNAGVLVIGLLCVHQGPHMIDSWIYHHGGPVFCGFAGPLAVLRHGCTSRVTLKKEVTLLTRKGVMLRLMEFLVVFHHCSPGKLLSSPNHTTMKYQTP
jgi:hypothetical protein